VTIFRICKIKRQN